MKRASAIVFVTLMSVFFIVSSVMADLTSSGGVASAPAIAWNPNISKMQIVVRAADSSLWEGTFTNGAFDNNWASVPGGSTPDAPALAWNESAGVMQLIIRGSDNGLYASTFNNSTGLFNNNWTNFYQQSTSTYSISGAVSGLAAGVQVQLSLAGGKTATTMCAGTGGTYTFGGLAKGTYTVTPSQISGYTVSPTSSGTITINNSSVGSVNFTATASTPNPGGDLAGTTNLGTNGFLDLVKIPAYGYQYYKVVVPSTAAGKTLSITLGSRDYTTKQVMMIKKGTPQLSIDDYHRIADCFYNGGTACTPGIVLGTQYLSNGPTHWFKLDKGITYASYVVNISKIVPDTYYVIVVNRSSATGTYRIFDSIY